jgi:hypothetical protein
MLVLRTYACVRIYERQTDLRHTYNHKRQEAESENVFYCCCVKHWLVCCLGGSGASYHAVEVIAQISRISVKILCSFFSFITIKH